MKYFKTTFTFSIQDKTSADETTITIAKELCPAMAGDIGYESFDDTDDGIAGYIQQQLFDEKLLDKTFSSFPLSGIKVKWQTEAVEDKNWNEEWEKSGFPPIIISDRCIIHDTEHIPEKHYETDITIDARQAFGTGTHDTTQMIVNELLSMKLVDKSTLDCGCGTGILSIAAVKLGARKATGYDIDEWSVRNTEHNAELNGIDNIKVLLGDSTVLNNEIKEEFDLVMANINRNILLNDMPAISSHVKRDGELILSGFYTDDAEIIEKKAEGFGLMRTYAKSSNGWCVLKLKKN